jgi:hypothetical protein
VVDLVVGLSTPAHSPAVLDHVTELDMKRYLRARKGDVKAACAQLTESVAWRATMDADAILSSPFPDFEMIDWLAPSMYAPPPCTHTPCICVASPLS